eukprot:352209-Hanusia_phi.AAC.1
MMITEYGTDRDRTAPSRIIGSETGASHALSGIPASPINLPTELASLGSESEDSLREVPGRSLRYRGARYLSLATSRAPRPGAIRRVTVLSRRCGWQSDTSLAAAHCRPGAGVPARRNHCETLLSLKSKVQLVGTRNRDRPG